MAVAHALSALLQETEVLPGRQIGADVITMYSQFELDLGGQGRCSMAICYPEDAEPAAGFISVLSPIGLALIGCRRGAHVQWESPGGRSAGTIATVLFQPEASGDYVS